MALQPNDSIGPYLLIRQLGRGAFGEVWLARHHHLDEERAVKVPTDADYVRQLRTEAKIQFRLNHPNIVRTVDLMPDHDPPFYVMEYVAGVDLRQKLRAAGKLPLAEARLIIRQILSALEHAHAAGIYHRDLKPENILCRADGVVKVTDFGFGKVQAVIAQSIIISGSLANAGSVAGTVQYMSPQQQAGEDADARDDLYAVGVIACELLTGLRPQPMGVTKMLGRVHVDVGFAALLEKALEHDRKDRFASAAKMREALDKFAAPTAVATRPAQVPVSQPATDGLTELANVVARQSARSNKSSGKSRPARNRKVWMWAGIAVGGIGALLLIALLTLPSHSLEIYPIFPAGSRVFMGALAVSRRPRRVVQTYPLDPPGMDLITLAADVPTLPFTEEERQIPSLLERRGGAPTRQWFDRATPSALPWRDQRQPEGGVAQVAGGIR